MGVSGDNVKENDSGRVFMRKTCRRSVSGRQSDRRRRRRRRKGSKLGVRSNGF